MKKKYFTEEQRKAARKIEARKYYEKIRKPPLTNEEIEKLKEERNKKRKEYLKEYYLKNKEQILVNSKEYFKNNKEVKQRKNNARYRKRRKEDPVFKLATNIRRNFRGILKKQNYTKKSKTYNILGCTFEEFKKHLESQFEPWMNWDNYGKYNGEYGYGWDIDHIIPQSSAISEAELIKLNHYSNLQPLDSRINRVDKRNKWADKIILIEKVDNISKISLK